MDDRSLPLNPPRTGAVGRLLKIGLGCLEVDPGLRRGASAGHGGRIGGQADVDEDAAPSCIAPVGAVIPIRYSGSGAGNGMFELALAVPNNPYIVGLRFNVQAIVNDSGATGGIAASEGLESVIRDPNA